MKPWKIVAIPTAIMLVIAGIYMFSNIKSAITPASSTRHKSRS